VRDTNNETERKHCQSLLYHTFSKVGHQSTDVSKEFWDEVATKRSGVGDLIAKTIDEHVLSYDDVQRLKKQAKEFNRESHIVTYLVEVIRRLNMNLLTQEQVRVIMENIKNQNGVGEREAAAIELIEQMATVFPELGIDAIHSITAMISVQQNENMTLNLLKILEHTANYCQQKNQWGHFDDAQLIPQLLKLSMSPMAIDHPNIAKYCAKILVKVDHSKMELDKIVDELTLAPIEFSKDLPQRLSFLEVVMETLPEFALKKMLHLHLSEQLIKNILKRNEATHQKSIFFSEPNETEKCKIAAFSFLYAGVKLYFKSNTFFFEEFYALCFAIIEASGEPNALKTQQDNNSSTQNLMSQDMEDETNEDDEPELGVQGRAHMRLWAAKTILKVLSNELVAYLDIHQYLTLVRLCRDESINVRREMLSLISSYIVENKVPHIRNRMNTLLLIFVGDEDRSIAAAARKYFTTAIRYARSATESSGISMDHQFSPVYFPEYMLPYMIFVLSRWPDFDSLYPNFDHFQKIFFAFYDEVLVNDALNFSFIIQLCQKLKERRDFEHPESHNCLILTDLAIKILMHSMQGKLLKQDTYDYKLYIPSFFKSVSVLHGEDRFKRDLNVIFLPSTFTVRERYARTFVVPSRHSVPTKKSKSSTRQRSKTKRKSSTSRRKKKKKNEKAFVAHDSSPVVPRRKPSSRRRRRQLPDSYEQLSDGEFEEMMQDDHSSSDNEEEVTSDEEVVEEEVTSEEEERPRRRRRHTLNE